MDAYVLTVLESWSKRFTDWLYSFEANHSSAVLLDYYLLTVLIFE